MTAHNKKSWRKYWQETRARSMMKRYGSWDGKAQFFGEWKRQFTITIYGKNGRKLSSFHTSHEGKWDRDEVAARWATVKEYLKVGQRATITHGRITHTIRKTA